MVALLGNLGKDPQVREIPSGKVVSFSLATSDSWTDREGNKQERTDWHRVVAYNGLGEIAERFLRKGSRVYLEGQLQTRKWTDEEGTQAPDHHDCPGQERLKARAARPESGLKAGKGRGFRSSSRW
jgi:single stranded DNA-binding protein